jgi:integral membrane protein (TIGR01906 family)
MRRAPTLVGLVFFFAVGVALVLTGPLLLFAPPVVGALQQRHDVPARVGTSRAEVDRVTGELLADLLLRGDFGATLDGRPVLDARERTHMRDVGALVRVLVVIEVSSLLIALLAGAALRSEPRRQGLWMIASSALVGGLALLAAVAFALAFTAAFSAFHQLFFAPGTWLFAPGSRLIALFPQPFWFEVALAAGALIVLSAALVGWLGWRRLHSAAGC